MNPLLYKTVHGPHVFREVTDGNNGAYHARPGWNACTGWGTPHGRKLLDALSPKS